MVVQIVESTRAEREREVENALASVRMEGLEPSPGALAIYRSYVDGEVTSEEMDRQFDAYLERQHGPVRLPRD